MDIEATMRVVVYRIGKGAVCCVRITNRVYTAFIWIELAVNFVNSIPGCGPRGLTLLR